MRSSAPGQTTSVEMSCFGGGDETLKEQRRQNKLIDAQLKKDKDVYKGTHRLLLLGESYIVSLTCVHLYSDNDPCPFFTSPFQDIMINPGDHLENDMLVQHVSVSLELPWTRYFILVTTKLAERVFVEQPLEILWYCLCLLGLLFPLFLCPSSVIV